MRFHLKKSIAAMLTMAMIVSAFAGCSSNEGITIPTPTPRGIKEKVTVTPTKGGEVPREGSDAEALLQPAGSYEAVFEAIQTVRESRDKDSYGFIFDDGWAWIEEEVLEFATMDSVATAEPDVYDSAENGAVSGGGDKSFSETNVQVAGIDEADIMKTDGSYFYIFNLHRNEIYIVSAKGGEMELVAAIPASDELSGNETGREMYLQGNRLILLVSGYRDNHAVTQIFTYDISKKSEPKLLSTLEQDGSLVSSRCTDGKVYVISSHRTYRDWYYSVDEAEAEDENLMDYIPMADGERIAPDCIYISEEPVSEEFLVVTAMSPEQPQEYLDVKSLLADGDECYVSSNYIYVCSSRWQNREIPYDRTELYRFAYADGVITPAGQVTVKGTLDDQFSMDEYNGYLRIVTTVNEYDNKTNEETNALYIYDENLQLTGSIENLAPDEEVKSARLMGDVGYFVTFRQTDPLFSVDLSDPTNPKILGELKIPGFSAYLHPYGENLLLGIGYDADEETGWTECVKLSMFDVSDPTNVKEVHKFYLEEFSDTAVASNHKSALIDIEKNIIGLPARGYGENGEYNVYLVFGYDEETGFYQKLSEGYAIDWDSYQYEFKYEFFYSDCRGAYIEDTFYLINPAYEVRAYDTETWEQTGREGLVMEIEERKELLSKIEEKNPEPIVIELVANPSTGYTWSSMTEGRAVSLAKVESIAAEGTEQLPGAPVTERYTFEVNDIGTTTVTFEYARMWESKAPLRRIVYVISVDENLEARIESVTEE
ncbi:MAG: beta-propeller domain-containing protein [Lachnospiraceae bacterium]|nr:beta-propeller domain-containing protein [Lachnospiraceae bacterium]